MKYHYVYHAVSTLFICWNVIKNYPSRSEVMYN